MKISAGKITFFFAVLTLLIFNSCHDYRLDNAISDIARPWQLVRYDLNGGDSTTYFTSIISGYTVTFTPEGFYTESYSVFGIPTTISGAYNFQDNLSQLVMSDEDTTRVFDVIDLTPHKLTIELINTPDDEDIYYLEPAI